MEKDCIWQQTLYGHGLRVINCKQMFDLLRALFKVVKLKISYKMKIIIKKSKLLIQDQYFFSFELKFITFLSQV